MSKKNKDKSLYDENGRWKEERTRIKGAMRREFKLSPQFKEAVESARVELPPALKKDGTPGKKPRVRYQCAICGELFQKKNIQVDHIDPVVPLTKKESNMDYNEIAERMFCSKDNLQIVCSVAMKYNDGKPSCHKKKTDEENYIRDRITVMTEDYSLNYDYWIDYYKKEFQKYLKEKERKADEKRRKREQREERKRQKNLKSD